MLRQRGFTLIELMIGVAITAVLATFSFSAFKGTMEKADFKTMHEVASRLALSQQRHRLSFSQYATTINTTGTPSLTTMIFTDAQSYNVNILKATLTEFQMSIEPKSAAGLSDIAKHCYRIIVTSQQGFLNYTSTNDAGVSNTDCLPHA
jgi:prepilin-type N-terminal cleavage/methylation domain-containing protein